jgi:hypothetical protein
VGEGDRSGDRVGSDREMISPGSADASRRGVRSTESHEQRRRVSLAATCEETERRGGRRQLGGGDAGSAISVACARANTRACGQPLASASHTFRVVTWIRAPIFSSVSRMVWHCARASDVPASASRRSAWSNTYAIV